MSDSIETLIVQRAGDFLREMMERKINLVFLTRSSSVHGLHCIFTAFDKHRGVVLQWGGRVSEDDSDKFKLLLQLGGCPVQNGMLEAAELEWMASLKSPQLQRLMQLEATPHEP